MFRRSNPRDSAGNPRSNTSLPHVPSPFRNRYEAERSRRYASPSTSILASRNRRVYGPARLAPSRVERDRRYWSWYFTDSAAEDEKREKEKRQKLEEKRLREEEVEKLEALTVKDLHLHIRGNAFEHNTLKFECTKGDNAQPVLRRGQEFNVTIIFNRAYQKDKDDLIFMLDADDENPGKNLKERFKLDEDGSATYRKDEDWGARIVEADAEKKTMKLAVYIPGDCVVGEWDLQVKTALQDKAEDFVYVYPQPLVILFNPWSSVDLVHFTDDKALLKEYILNDAGSVFTGCAESIGSRHWSYGQFDKGILQICLSILRKAFGFKMTPCMSDPVMVSRALSKIVNDCGDNGVLVGNWSGDYSGGTRPTKWTSSTSILRQYESSGKPVRYGQCWVFSHVLTAVCRALGLPCRSVTNFDSAHDTDNTCTIDCYYSEDGDELSSMKSDSIWNFHVWNEVWLLRPDLPGGVYDGWHVIDATPQEQSNGVYQCGPCPLAAIKSGEINVGFDTGFVFSEVNAEVVHWVVDADGEVITHSAIKKDQVGNKLSTKTPDGKPHKKTLSWYSRDDPTLRLDLTNEYKFKEGSPEEREAVKRAVRFARHGRKLYKKSTDLNVTFDTNTQTMVGSDLVLTAQVKNVSKDDKDVEMVLAARTCRYWNHSSDDKHLAKEKFAKRTIKPGETESYSVTVTYKTYMESCDDSLSIFAYACAKDVKANMPYSAQKAFRLRRPDLDVEGPETANSGQPVTVSVSLTNPLPVPLTDCRFLMEGNLEVADDDKNPLETFFWAHTMSYRDVKPKETVTVTVRLVGNIEPDEDGRILTMDMSFNCSEIQSSFTGGYNLELHVPK